MDTVSAARRLAISKEIEVAFKTSLVILPACVCREFGVRNWDQRTTLRFFVKSAGSD